GAIRNALSILEQEGAPSASAVSQRAVIARQVRNLVRMVDDLLDVARLTNGKITLERRPIDLRTVVERWRDAFATTATVLEHELTIDLGPERVWVDGDVVRLEQIVSNLLSNALKYTPAGGRIAVRVSREGDDAVLRVSDTGIGIDPTMLPRVFDLFTQAEQTMDRSRGGLGVGLTLSRRLVEMHGGTITATSEGPGRGAQFTVRLPGTLARKTS